MDGVLITLRHWILLALICILAHAVSPVEAQSKLPSYRPAPTSLILIDLNQSVFLPHYSKQYQQLMQALQVFSELTPARTQVYVKASGSFISLNDFVKGRTPSDAANVHKAVLKKWRKLNNKKVKKQLVHIALDLNGVQTALPESFDKLTTKATGSTVMVLAEYPTVLALKPKGLSEAWQVHVKSGDAFDWVTALVSEFFELAELPVVDGIMSVDNTVSEFLVLSKQKTSAKLSLVTPSGKKLHSSRKHSFIKWQSKSCCLKAQVSKPEIGQWQLNQAAQQDAVVYAVSKIAMIAHALPEKLFPGETHVVSGRLIGHASQAPGKLSVNFQHNKGRLFEIISDDLPANQLKIAVLPNALNIGEISYQLQLEQDGLKRSLVKKVSIYPQLTKLKHEVTREGVEATHHVNVIVDNRFVDTDSLKLKVIAHDENAFLMPNQLNQAGDSSWLAKVVDPISSKSITVDTVLTGETSAGREFKVITSPENYPPPVLPKPVVVKAITDNSQTKRVNAPLFWTLLIGLHGLFVVGLLAIRRMLKNMSTTFHARLLQGINYDNK